MKLKNIYQKLGFTLVELIIVVVILAILASIAYLTLRDYPGNARDGVRKADITNLEKVMEIYSFQKGTLPDPDEPRTEEGDWIIGKFGTGVYAKINNIKPLPVDPSTEEYYTYALNKTTGKFKLTANLENGQKFTTGNAGGGNTSSSIINAIQNPNTVATFTKVTDKPLGTVNEYYVQSNTNLKWEANPSGYAQWATCSSNSSDTNYCGNYGSPVWNGTSYTYPSGKSATDYPAFKYCTDKGSGWRLPTKNEFLSIMTDKATEKNANGYYTLLPSVSINSYWSATEYVPSTHDAWITIFGGGSMGYNSKRYTYPVFCIHD